MFTTKRTKKEKGSFYHLPALPALRAWLQALQAGLPAVPALKTQSQALQAGGIHEIARKGRNVFSWAKKSAKGLTAHSPAMQDSPEATRVRRCGRQKCQSGTRAVSRAFRFPSFPSCSSWCELPLLRTFCPTS